MSSGSTPKSITRRKHKKSRVGCPQCKQKKAKCDETLPACSKCMARGVRCGYLDYTPREIEVVLLAHWEAQGADPDEMPIQPQQFNPTAQLDVVHKPPKFQDVEVILPPRLDEQDLGIVSQGQYTTSINSDYRPPLLIPVPLRPITSVYQQNTVEIAYQSEVVQPKLEIPLIKHTSVKPELDFTKFATYSYFNETITNFSVRFFIRTVVREHLHYAGSNLMLFHGTLLIGCGTFLSTHTELEDYFLRLRGICINFIIHGLSNVDDSNADPLLRVTVNLDTSSVFLKDRIGYKQHFKLSTGPSSLLQKVFQDPSKFPKSFKFLKTHADALLGTTKNVWMPPYDPKVLIEFSDVVTHFGKRFIIDGKDNHLKKQYDDLKKLLEFCLDLLENEKSPGLFVRYSIDKLYELLQRWYSVFPSECAALDNSRMNGIEKVFYVFWFTLLKILESIILNCRYIFSFFLDGFFLIHTFRREDIDDTLEKDTRYGVELQYTFNYCCRLISFFSRRAIMVMTNTILNEPIPVFLQLKDRLKARPLDIHEVYITNFRDTVIKKIHYPAESTKVTGFKSSKDLLNYYMTNEDVGDSLVEILNDLTPNDEPETSIDLIHNINPKTSLLNNDFDPRFTDPVFDKPYVFQEADLDFIERYIEDRRAIVQMITEDTEDYSDSDESAT